MHRGTVKWFDDKKGFGFLTVEGVSVDVFVHFQQIKSAAKRRTLKEGQTVECEITKSDRGFRAEDVAVV